MKKFALIVAGGRGTRMKGTIPKQFAELDGKPILMHTFEAFLKFDNDFSFVLVLAEPVKRYWDNLCSEHKFNIKHQVVAGGETRFHSVKNGLDEIKEEGIVFIHDGVRPLVSVQTLRNCYYTALEKGNALPVIPPSESIREIINSSSRAANRNRFYLVQTPQTFKVSKIKEAYQCNFSESFTDDATVLENTGAKIYLVEGNRENIKITFPSDLLIASALKAIV